MTYRNRDTSFNIYLQYHVLKWIKEDLIWKMVEKIEKKYLTNFIKKCEFRHQKAFKENWIDGLEKIYGVL